MGRLLLLILVLLGVFCTMRVLITRRRRPIHRGDATQQSIEKMLECAHCHTFFPQRDQVSDQQGRIFCSSAHQHEYHQGDQGEH